MHNPPIPNTGRSDPEIARLVHDEARRQYEKARLIPSENYVSVAVLEASGSVLTNKYSEGYPGRRYYEGQQFIDQIETIARDRAKALFGVDHANVQPYSGSPANLAVYLAFAQPGDTIMGMALPMGGHLTHGWSVSATGKWFRAVQYGVRHDTGTVDLDEVRDLALKERPKIIFCGGTAIPRTIAFPAFADIAAESGALLVADIAHIAGLIAGGAHPSPVGYAPVITTTTHKTLRGPRAAVPRLRPGLRRHRQPPDPDGPHRQGYRRQAGRQGAGPGRDRDQLQHGAVRPAQAVRPVRPADRHPGHHHPRPARGAYDLDRRLDGRGHHRGHQERRCGPGPLRGRGSRPAVGLPVPRLAALTRRSLIDSMMRKRSWGCRHPARVQLKP